MKAQLRDAESKRGKSVAVSFVAHVVLALLIGSITFHYPLSAFLHFRHDEPTERIQYVQLRPKPLEGGSGPKTTVKPKQIVPARPLVAPTVTPSTIPDAQPAIPVTGTGGLGGSGVGEGNGAPGGTGGLSLVPTLPDPRIGLKGPTLRLPLTQAQRNDSAVTAIFLAFRAAEIATMESQGRSPRDWTFERGGQKYGLDSQYVYLGRFKIPSAVLAALPLNFGGVDGGRIIQARNASWIQQDIYMHSQGMSEDDFRAAAKRIRERKDRERKEAEDQAKTVKNSPIVP